MKSGFPLAARVILLFILKFFKLKSLRDCGLTQGLASYLRENLIRVQCKTVFQLLVVKAPQYYEADLKSRADDSAGRKHLDFQIALET